MPTEAIETLAHPSGITVQIIPDTDGESPDGWDDEGVFLVAFHRQFWVQRKGWSKDEIERYAPPEGPHPERLDAQYSEDIAYFSGSGYPEDRADASLRERQADYDEQVKRANKYEILPLIAYIHSGVALSLGRDGYPFTDRFDSGQVGYVVIKRDEVSDVRKAAEGLVETWNQYLSGDVYGVVVKDADGEILDSCWGYYGFDTAREEARSQIKNYADQGVLPFIPDTVTVKS